MTRNECPDAGVYLKSIGRDDLYKEWAYRYGSLEEMDLEHLSNTALEKMAQNPQAISYFKERPELIQTYTSYLLRNSAIFKGT